MNSKERILAAFSRQIPDRVPIFYLANPGLCHQGIRRVDYINDYCRKQQEALG